MVQKFKANTILSRSRCCYSLQAVNVLVCHKLFLPFDHRLEFHFIFGRWQTITHLNQYYAFRFLLLELEIHIKRSIFSHLRQLG